MQFKVSHYTKYTYSEPVFLEPHYYRFRPRTTPHQKVLDFDLKVSPLPAGHWELLDEENNHVALYWFNGQHLEMVIQAVSVVETKEYNPLGFFIYPTSHTRLNKLEGIENIANKKFIPKELVAYVRDELREAAYDTINFLTLLTRHIHQTFRLYTRENGETQTPLETWKEQQGSCRDLAWLQVELLRIVGLSARFVSGYCYVDVDDVTSQPELHAWTEVYLPGAGWIGLDPSHGIFTGHHHFSVVSKNHYLDTNPVSGSLRGSGESVMNTILTITHIL